MANAFWKLISVSKTSECQSTGSTTVKYHTVRPLACLVAWWLKKKKKISCSAGDVGSIPAWSRE